MGVAPNVGNLGEAYALAAVLGRTARPRWAGREPEIVARVLMGDVVRRYPRHASLLSRFDLRITTEVKVMGVSCVGGGFRLRVNPRFVLDHPEFVPGVVLHEINHVLLGHTTEPRFGRVRFPELMELAMEASANEYIAEPLFGAPITVERLAAFGVKPHQSTQERYDALFEARRDPRLMMLRLAVLDDHLADGVRRGLGQRGKGTRSQRDAVLGIAPRAERIDWRRALREFVRARRRPVFSRLHPNRRRPDRIGEVPGRVRRPHGDRRPRLLVAVDTSSSMRAEDLSEIGAELPHLAEHAELTVVECDTEVKRVYPFEGSLETVVGRGGTDLSPVFESALLERVEAEAVVYFTDGDGPHPPHPPPIPTLWVLIGGDDGFACPWGERALM